jgi:hypothetical protein
VEALKSDWCAIATYGCRILGFINIETLCCDGNRRSYTDYTAQLRDAGVFDAVLEVLVDSVFLHRRTEKSCEVMLSDALLTISDLIAGQDYLHNSNMRIFTRDSHIFFQGVKSPICRSVLEAMSTNPQNKNILCSACDLILTLCQNSDVMKLNFLSWSMTNAVGGELKAWKLIRHVLEQHPDLRVVGTQALHALTFRRNLTLYRSTNVFEFFRPMGTVLWKVSRRNIVPQYPRYLPHDDTVLMDIEVDLFSLFIENLYPCSSITGFSGHSYFEQQLASLDHSISQRQLA